MLISFLDFLIIAKYSLNAKLYFLKFSVIADYWRLQNCVPKAILITWHTRISYVLTVGYSRHQALRNIAPLQQTFWIQWQLRTISWAKLWSSCAQNYSTAWSGKKRRWKHKPLSPSKVSTVQQERAGNLCNSRKVQSSFSHNIERQDNASTTYTCCSPRAQFKTGGAKLCALIWTAS